MKKNIVVFNVKPTENPDETVSYSRYIINTSTGIGMDTLKDVVKKYVPIVDHDEVHTIKEIIRTDRYECPCCNTSITAIIYVSCEGLMTKEWSKVNGYYLIKIDPDHGGCKIVVEKLVGTKIHESRCVYLPKKDYATNPEVKKEIEERETFFKDEARKNPDKIVRVGGIGTEKDLAKLVTVLTKNSSVNNCSL